jgi:hypothetical protein
VGSGETTFGTTVFPDNCAFWSKLLLKPSGREICGSRATKRNNSAIAYSDGAGCSSYGLQQDIMTYSEADAEHLVKLHQTTYLDPLTGCITSLHSSLQG